MLIRAPRLRSVISIHIVKLVKKKNGSDKDRVRITVIPGENSGLIMEISGALIHIATIIKSEARKRAKADLRASRKKASRDSLFLLRKIGKSAFRKKTGRTRANSKKL